MMFNFITASLNFIASMSPRILAAAARKRAAKNAFSGKTGKGSGAGKNGTKTKVDPGGSFKRYTSGNKGVKKIIGKIGFWDFVTTSIELMVLNWVVVAILPDDEDGKTAGIVEDYLLYTEVVELDANGKVVKKTKTNQSKVYQEDWWDLDDDDAPLIVVAYGLIRWTPWGRLAGAGVGAMNSVRNAGILAGTFGKTAILMPVPYFVGWFNTMATFASVHAGRKAILALLDDSKMIFTSLKSKEAFMEVVKKLYLYRNEIVTKYANDINYKNRVNIAFITAFATAYALWVTKEDAVEKQLQSEVKSENDKARKTQNSNKSDKVFMGMNILNVYRTENTLKNDLTEMYNKFFINGLYTADVRSMATDINTDINTASDTLVLVQMLGRRCISLGFTMIFDDEWPHSLLLDKLSEQCSKITSNIGVNNYINAPLVSKILDIIEKKDKNVYNKQTKEILDILIGTWDPEIGHSLICSNIDDVAYIIAEYPTKLILQSLQIKRDEFDTYMLGVEKGKKHRTKMQFIRDTLLSQLEREKARAKAKGKKTSALDLNANDIATTASATTTKKKTSGSTNKVKVSALDTASITKASNILQDIKGGHNV